MLEMPLKGIKKLESQKDLYEEGLNKYQQMMEQENMDESLTEIQEKSQVLNESGDSIVEFKRTQVKKAKQPLKITYYNTNDEENRQMTMQERIKRTNDNIDKYLHNNEYSGVDSVKYDLIIPIKDIPITTGRMDTGKNISPKSQIKQENWSDQHSEEEDEQLYDPFSADDFGKSVFVNEDEQERGNRRDQEVRNKEELKKNIYLFHPLAEVEQEKVKRSSFDDLKTVEFEYRTDDYDPLVLASKTKPKSSHTDIQARVNSTLSKLNQGPNSKEKFIMNLPKVIQQNQRDYQNYFYEGDKQYSNRSISPTE